MHSTPITASELASKAEQAARMLREALAQQGRAADEQSAGSEGEQPSFFQQSTCFVLRMLIASMAAERGHRPSPLVSRAAVASAGDAKLFGGVGTYLFSRKATPDVSPVADDLSPILRLTLEKASRLLAVNDAVAPPEFLGTVYEVLLEAERQGAPTAVQRNRSRRKRQGSFYTPLPLIEHLLDHALEPLVQERLDGARRHAARSGACVVEAQAHAILSITVCDPAVGSGHFLIAAARRLASRLAHLRADSSPGSANVYQSALCDVIEKCLFGVDIDPVAVDICKLSLWLECGADRAVCSSLNKHLLVGNALLGARTDLVEKCFAAGTLASSCNERTHNQPSPQHVKETIEYAAPCAPAEKKRTHDAWCASFFPRSGEAADGLPAAAVGGKGLKHRQVAINPHARQVIAGEPGRVSAVLLDHIEQVAQRYRFLHWHLAFPDILSRGDHDNGFDLVLGNPPFLNQLRTNTAVDRNIAALLRATTDGIIKGYADVASAFLVLAIRICRSRGRVGLVQPQSLLVSRDAGPVRDAVLATASLRHLWVSGAHIFEGASVSTCAPILEVDGQRDRDVTRSASASCVALPTVRVEHDRLRTEETWGPLAAPAFGIPACTPSTSPSVGEKATATADFRDQYYGLRGAIREDAEVPLDAEDRDERWPRIVTTGMIDLAACRWGQRPSRLLKHQWRAPRLSVEALAAKGDLDQWVAARRVPKIILATQTKVLEVFVDEEGRCVPSLPLITVVPRDPRDLWPVAAAIASPVCTALAMQRYAGAGLSVQAIKLGAQQVLRLPLPTEHAPWHEAIDLLKQAHATERESERMNALLAFASAITAAYALPADETCPLLEWWAHRLAGPAQASAAF